MQDKRAGLEASSSASTDEERVHGTSPQKTFAILEAVANADRPLRIAEAAFAAGVSRPTAYRLVQTLVAAGYLAQDPNSGRLEMGYSVLRLAATLLDRNRMRIEALPHLQSLSNLTGERTNLGIIHRNNVLYLAGVEKPTLPTIYSRFGKSAPAHCCSLGKAILAHLPEADVQCLIASAPLISQTPNSITSWPRFRKELRVTRERGYGIDKEEHIVGSCCVSAPIFGIGNRVVGAIGLSGRSLEPLLLHAEVVRHTADLISHVL